MSEKQRKCEVQFENSVNRIIINNDSIKKKIIAVQGTITNRNPQNGFPIKRLLNLYSDSFFRFLFINSQVY